MDERDDDPDVEPLPDEADAERCRLGTALAVGAGREGPWAICGLVPELVFKRP